MASKTDADAPTGKTDGQLKQESYEEDPGAAPRCPAEEWTPTSKQRTYSDAFTPVDAAAAAEKDKDASDATDKR